MKRLFFALWPDHKTRQSLVQVSHLIRAQAMKVVQPRNFHVTLVFLGNVDDETESLINQGIDDISAKAFDLTFDQLSYWSRPKVLCLTCSHSVTEYVDLAVAVEQRVRDCGLQIDSQPYTPHITLARHVRHVTEISFEPILWRAESFCLVQSCSEPGGVIYEVLKQWPLSPGIK